MTALLAWWAVAAAAAYALLLWRHPRFLIRVLGRFDELSRRFFRWSTEYAIARERGLEAARAFLRAERGR